MKILNERQIKQKIKRLAFEILEENYEERQIILAGINNNGVHFSKLLQKELKKITDIELVMTTIKLNPADPLSSKIQIDYPLPKLHKKVIIIVDDVANTGRTIFYAIKPLLDALPKKIEAAVLIDRKHKSFPVRVDYVGLSLATTLKEDIDVRIRSANEMSVYLN
jgi:pyrimidine operon attenuation protein/uracil phosphoribosyltransferase